MRSGGISAAELAELQAAERSSTVISAQIPPWMQHEAVPSDGMFRNHWTGKEVEAPLNPWSVKKGGYVDEDTEAHELLNAPRETLRKMFEPSEKSDQAAANRVSSAFTKALAAGDGFYSVLDAEISNARYPELARASSHERTASDGWDEEVPTFKKREPLTYRERIGQDGERWVEGFNQAGELQTARIVY